MSEHGIFAQGRTESTLAHDLGMDASAARPETCYNNFLMDEVAGILIALGGLVVGLLVLGWAYGDFNPPKSPSS